MTASLFGAAEARAEEKIAPPAAPAAAQQLISPGDTVGEVFARIKQERSMLPVLEYVDWKLAFESLAKEEGKAMGVTSPAEYKQYYRTMFTEPVAFINGLIESQKKVISPEEQKALSAELQDGGYKAMIANLEDGLSKMKEALGAMTYKIVSTRTTDIRAWVVVESTMDGEQHKEEFELVKSEGRWLFPDMSGFEDEVAQQ